MERLTTRQLEALDFIVSEVKRYSTSPTIREIGFAMGIRSTNGVSDHLKALVRKGYIRMVKGRSRGMLLTDKAKKHYGLENSGIHECEIQPGQMSRATLEAENERLRFERDKWEMFGRRLHAIAVELREPLKPGNPSMEMWTDSSGCVIVRRRGGDGVAAVGYAYQGKRDPLADRLTDLVGVYNDLFGEQVVKITDDEMLLPDVLDEINEARQA